MSTFRACSFAFLKTRIMRGFCHGDESLKELPFEEPSYAKPFDGLLSAESWALSSEFWSSLFLFSEFWACQSQLFYEDRKSKSKCRESPTFKIEGVVKCFPVVGMALSLYRLILF